MKGGEGEMENIFCLKCNRNTKAKIQHKEEIFPVKGDPIAVKSEILICSICGEDVFDEGRDAKNLELAYSLYRKKHGLLSQMEIKDIRERYGLSQRALSRLLGWGEITLHRYENGAIQDMAHDRLLRFIEDPMNMRKLFERNQSDLPYQARAALKDKLDDLTAKGIEAQFYSSLEKFVSHKTIDFCSGFREYDFQKFMNMVMYFGETLKGVLKTKLNKLLWYADFLHFKSFSVSISGSRYLHFKYGPVPENYDLIIAGLVCEGILAKEEILFDEEKDIIEENFIPTVPADKKVFTQDELKVLDFVSSYFELYGSAKIADFSHREKAYNESESSGYISYKHATQLSISLPES